MIPFAKENHQNAHNMLNEILNRAAGQYIPNAGKYLELSIEGEDYYPWQQGLFQGDPYRVEAGQVTIPDSPGWGIEINPAWLERASYKKSEM